MNQRFEGKFRLSKHKFNASDMGSMRHSRKYMYAVGSKDVYVVGYEHGGYAYHCHAIIFRTNGKQVVNMYNLVTLKHGVSELAHIIEYGGYKYVRYNEY